MALWRLNSASSFRVFWIFRDVLDLILEDGAINSAATELVFRMMLFLEIVRRILELSDERQRGSTGVELSGEP